ncbi:MAG: hypothetical protein WB983_13300, partial [Terriglobales bacterium]
PPPRRRAAAASRDRRRWQCSLNQSSFLTQSFYSIVLPNLFTQSFLLVLLLGRFESARFIQPSYTAC